jgi:hypothetical protein
MPPALDATLEAFAYAGSSDIDEIINLEETLQVELGAYLVVLDHVWVIHLEFYKVP